MRYEVFAAYRAAVWAHMAKHRDDDDALEGIEKGLFYGLHCSTADIMQQLTPADVPGAPHKSPATVDGIRLGIEAGLAYRKKFGEREAEHAAAQLDQGMETPGDLLRLCSYIASPATREPDGAAEDVPEQLTGAARLVQALSEEEDSLPECRGNERKAQWQRSLKRAIANLRVAYLTADSFEREEALACAGVLLRRLDATQGVCDE